MNGSQGRRQLPTLRPRSVRFYFPPWCTFTVLIRPTSSRHLRILTIESSHYYRETSSLIRDSWSNPKWITRTIERLFYSGQQNDIESLQLMHSQKTSNLNTNLEIHRQAKWLSLRRLRKVARYARWVVFAFVRRSHRDMCRGKDRFLA